MESPMTHSKATTLSMMLALPILASGMTSLNAQSTGTAAGAATSRAQIGAKSPAGVVLPNTARPRVVLRVARKKSARSTAAALQRSLRAQGLEVVKANNAPPSLKANQVIYYYAEDRSSAERIAGGVSSTPPIQKQFSEDNSLPRPGTIEVAIVQ